MKISPIHKKTIEDLLPEARRQAFVDSALSAAITQYKMTKENVIEAYVDGGSRGNPGPAGGGFVIFKAGRIVMKGSEFFGRQTNNQAEYLALRMALREAYDICQDCAINVFMDSQLVVEQMNGNYKVKSENVKPLYTEVRRIADQFKSFSIKYIPRLQNKKADGLANEAMDRG